MKNKLTKIILSSLLVNVGLVGNFSIENNILAYSEKTGEWKKSNDDRWWYKFSGDSYAVGWEKISGKWYYFDSSGWMKTGWIKVSEKWYYLESSGEMITGWKKINSKWYHFNSSGSMETGWIKLDDGYWYYLNDSGSMETGWISKNLKRYYLESSGRMVTGYREINGLDYKFSYNGDLEYSGDMIVSIFGKKYTDIDTTSDVDLMEKILLGTEYTVQAFRDASRNDFYMKSKVNKENINVGVLVYSGHGVENTGEIYLGRNEILSGQDFPRLNNTKLALFFCCYGGNSLVNAAIQKGAKAAYGYSDVSYVSEDRVLEKEIFNKLLLGENIGDVLNEIKMNYRNFNVVKNNSIVFQGDKNIKLRETKMIKKYLNISQILDDELQKEFVDKGGVLVRVYKGIETMDSIFLENGVVKNYKLSLKDTDLSVLDDLISEKKEGSMYDQLISKSLNMNEKIGDVFSIIAANNDKPMLVRKYYILNTETMKYSKTIHIDVSTGKRLSDEEINKIFGNK